MAKQVWQPIRFEMEYNGCSTRITVMTKSKPIRIPTALKMIIKKSLTKYQCGTFELMLSMIVLPRETHRMRSVGRWRKREENKKSHSTLSAPFSRSLFLLFRDTSIGEILLHIQMNNPSWEESAQGDDHQHRLTRFENFSLKNVILAEDSPIFPESSRKIWNFSSTRKFTRIYQKFEEEVEFS